MIPTGIKRVATMIILEHQEQYLLLKRAKAPNKGMYLPVGGKLEPFEDPETCVIRECFEETKIKIEAPIFCGILTESSTVDYNWLSYIYKATIPYQPPPYCDEGILDWIDITDIETIPNPPTNRTVYQYVQRNQKFVFNAIYNDKLELIHMKEMLENKIISFKPYT